MKHQVLLLDDAEKSLFRSLRPSLPAETWELVPVANPKQAIAKSDAGETDLIVMTLDSRASAGWEAIDEITEANPFLPVIAITKQPGLKDLAEAVGARVLVEQPVDVAALVQTVQKLVVERKEQPARGNVTAEPAFRQVASRSGASLANLQQRYNAPYAMTTSFRHWGINE